MTLKLPFLLKRPQRYTKKSKEPEQDKVADGQKEKETEKETDKVKEKEEKKGKKDD